MNNGSHPSCTNNTAPRFNKTEKSAGFCKHYSDRQRSKPTRNDYGSDWNYKCIFHSIPEILIRPFPVVMMIVEKLVSPGFSERLALVSLAQDEWLPFFVYNVACKSQRVVFRPPLHQFTFSFMDGARFGSEERVSASVKALPTFLAASAFTPADLRVRAGAVTITDTDGMMDDEADCCCCCFSIAHRASRIPVKVRLFAIILYRRELLHGVNGAISDLARFPHVRHSRLAVK